MTPSEQDTSPVVVTAGNDRFNQQRGLGVSNLEFKLSHQDTATMFAVENVFHAKGGPARHLHVAQDEWFYTLEGQFLIEVGDKSYTMQAGDSLFAPRNIPHVWAHIGDGIGRMLIVFSPAGQMEAFFHEVTKANAMPPQDPELWRAHGMELLGAPLDVSGI